MATKEEGSPSVFPSSGSGLLPRLAIGAAVGGEKTFPADVSPVREDSARVSHHDDRGMEPEDEEDPSGEEPEGRGEEPFRAILHLSPQTPVVLN